MKIKNKKIVGKRVFAFTHKEKLLDFIIDKRKILIAINAEKLMKTDDKLTAIINENIGYPDGVGAVMALKKHKLDTVKIAGADFWLSIVQKFYRQKSFYLLGATQAVIEATVAQLQKDYPTINIVGYRNGYLSTDDVVTLKQELKRLQPDIIFVAQGSPKQEYLMNELMQSHKALYMGLGGSFDVYCGLKKRAPDLFIRLNLEWLYRLLKEPTRVSRQFSLLKFMVLLWVGKI